MGELEIQHDKAGIIPSTIGRIGSLPENLLRLTPGASFNDVSPAMANYIQENFGNEDWKANIKVYLNHSPLFQQIQRLFSKERRTNLFLRSTMGLLSTLTAGVISKVTRRDYYNPFSESVQIFHPSKAIALRQVGQALDYDKSKYPNIKALSGGGGLLSAFFLHLPMPGVIRGAWRASKRAYEHTPDADKNEVNKILESQFVLDSTRNILPFAVVGKIPLVGKLATLPILGIFAAAHAHARLGKRSMFFNTESLHRERKLPKPLDRMRAKVKTAIASRRRGS